MQRNTEWCGFCPTRDLFHVERALVVDRNYSLTHVDGLANCISKLIAEAAMRNERPAAEIDSIDIGTESVEPSGRNDRWLIAESLQLFQNFWLDGQDFESVFESFVQPVM